MIIIIIMFKNMKKFFLLIVSGSFTYEIETKNVHEHTWKAQ